MLHIPRQTSAFTLPTGIAVSLSLKVSVAQVTGVDDVTSPDAGSGASSASSSGVTSEGVDGSSQASSQPPSSSPTSEVSSKTTTTTDDSTSQHPSTSSATTTSDSSSSSSTSSTTTSTTTTSTSSTSSTTSSTTSKTTNTSPTSSDTTSSTTTGTTTTSETFTSLSSVNSLIGSITATPTSSDLTSFTTIVTKINGQDTTLISALPTNLSSSTPSSSDTKRTAVIAGTTAGSLALLFLILAGLFLYRRRQNRKLGFIEALVRGRREGKGAGGVGLLDGEFDDDDDLPPHQTHHSYTSVGHSRSGSDNVPMTRYRDNVERGIGNSRVSNISAGVSSPAPSLFRARASDTGSMFHEAVWPPPGEFVDPFVGTVKEGEFRHIVDDVMGPAGSATAYGSGATGAGAALGVGAAAAAHASAHDRNRAANVSDSSILSERVHSVSVGSKTSLYTDPFRDASRAPSSSSVYYYDPATSGQASRRDSSYSQISQQSQQTQQSRNSPTPSALKVNPMANLTPTKASLIPLGAAKPEHPSPLVHSLVASHSTSSSLSAYSQGGHETLERAQSPPSAAKNWIQRSPKKVPSERRMSLTEEFGVAM